MKATEQYFRVVLFITLYKVVLTFESVNEIQKLLGALPLLTLSLGFAGGCDSPSSPESFSVLPLELL